MEQLLRTAERFSVRTGVELDDSGKPVLDAEEDEQLRAQCESVHWVFGHPEQAGSEQAGLKGKLFITTRRVVWVAGAPGACTSLALTYQQIMVHGTCKEASLPGPCIYMQLDDGSEDMEVLRAQQNEDGEEGGEGEEEDAAALTAEVRLMPEDGSQVEPLYVAMCDCAALNPDPEVEGEGDFFFDEAEVMAGVQQAHAMDEVAERMQQQELGDLVAGDPGRFEDDDEEEEEGEWDEGEEEAEGAVAGAAPGQHANGHPKPA